MVSTRVCGTLSLGSNPSRHPQNKTPERGVFILGVPKRLNCFSRVWNLKTLSLDFGMLIPKYMKGVQIM